MDQDPQHLRPSEASGIDLGVFRDAVGNLRRVGDGNNFQILHLTFICAPRCEDRQILLCERKMRPLGKLQYMEGHTIAPQIQNEYVSIADLV